jgi:uncharacterized protein (UPF0216 family)
MTNGLPYEKLLQQCLQGELRIANIGLPRQQKSLHDLLNEEHPHVVSCNGTLSSFKKKELQYIASLITPEEEKKLLLPIIIEIGNVPSEAVILCQSDIEGKVISKILGMPIKTNNNRIRLYRLQLALLRKIAKTTTQYVFSPGITE